MPDPVAAEADLQKDKWVVMIYMAATSPRLCAAMERDLRELNLRLANLDLNDIFVVVQADTPDGQYVTRQRLLGGGRVKSLKPQRLPLNWQPKRLTAKQFFIKKFLKWRFHNADKFRLTDPNRDPCDANGRPPSPACSYPVRDFGRTLLILWGHSQGIAAALSQPGSPAFAMVGDGGFGYDPLFGDALTLPQIRTAIVEGLKPIGQQKPNRIDILSFDSCFMGAAEAAVELQEARTKWRKNKSDHKRLRVNYLLAAQTAILLDGLDYSRLADVFVPNPCVRPEELGLRILSQAAYGDDSPTSLSLLRLRQRRGPKAARSRPFERSVRILVSVLRRVLGVPYQKPKSDFPHVGPNVHANRAEWLRIRDAFEAATWHRVRQFVDVGDLCRRLLNNSRDKAIRLAAWYVLQELKTEGPHRLRKHPRKQPKRFLIDVRSSHPLLLSGLSMYCPWLYPTPTETRAGAWNAVVSLKDYDELRFSRSTGWGRFLLDAKVLIDESRQRSINAELEDVRRAIHQAAQGRSDPPTKKDLERFRVQEPKPGDDRFQPAEPLPREVRRSAEALSALAPNNYSHYSVSAGDQILTERFGEVDVTPIAIQGPFLSPTD